MGMSTCVRMATLLLRHALVLFFGYSVHCSVVACTAPYAGRTVIFSRYFVVVHYNEGARCHSEVAAGHV